MLPSHENIVLTEDGSYTLKHPVHQECYHSKSGALLEAKKLYIQSSQFKEFLESSTLTHGSVLDVGLGLGLNALSTIEAWYESSGKISLTLLSVEIDKELVTSLLSQKAPWQKNWPARWVSLLSGFNSSLETDPSQERLTLVHPLTQQTLTWLIKIGDLSQELKSLTSWVSEIYKPFDFIWQDPFSPDHNPKLWVKEWFEELFIASKPGTKLLTYSVRRQVKDALTEAGWTWKLIPGAGRKRNWLSAQYPET